MVKKKKKYKNDLISKILLKTIICIILFLIFLICNKKIKNFNKIIYDNVYSSNISFAKINSWYESKFGSIFPFNRVNEVQVFNESINYNSKKEYKNGVLLSVNDNYIVPSISSGIVIFIGEKEEYGKTIIIEDENEIDYWYSNINIGNINMYDYINKGDYLGEVIDGELIMLFQRKGNFLDYNNYI